MLIAEKSVKRSKLCFGQKLLTCQKLLLKPRFEFRLEIGGIYSKKSDFFSDAHFKLNRTDYTFNISIYARTHMLLNHLNSKLSE